MNAGYWIVVASVTTAALASLLAAMGASREWRIPNRRTPLTTVFQLVSARFPPDDARDGASLAALRRFGLDEPQDFENARLEGVDEAMFMAGVDVIVRLRPNSVIIAGAQDLLMSGEPVEKVARLVATAVRPLSQIGSHSYVLGATPAAGHVTAQAGMDTKAIARLARTWNSELSRRLTPLGAVFVSSPGELFDAMETHRRRPVRVEADSEDDDTVIYHL